MVTASKATETIDKLPGFSAGGNSHGRHTRGFVERETAQTLSKRTDRAAVSKIGFAAVACSAGVAKART